MSAIHKLTKTEKKMDLLSLLTSSVTHEQLTPLKSIIAMCESLLKSKEIPELIKNKLKTIISATSIVLAQVKLLLDKTLFDKNVFQIQPENQMLLELTRETTDLLRSQASLKLINIFFIKKCTE